MNTAGFDRLRDFSVGVSESAPEVMTDGGVTDLMAVQDRNDRLALAAFALHGPLDIVLTTVGRRVCPGDPESNPIVRRLGEDRWLAIKGAALAGGGVAWVIGRDAALLAVPLGVLTALGVLLVLPNAVVVLGCLADQER